MPGTTLLSLFAALMLLMPVYVLADKSVAITQIVEHPALDAVRQGVQDELAAQGYRAGDNLDLSFESAQGSSATAAQIAKKFAGQEPDVIVAIATPSAQTMAAVARYTPIVFSAVTDPLGAKLVSSLHKPGRNITGVTDLTPIDRHMALIKRIVPGAKTVGVIFNPGEANSVTLVELVKKYAPQQGMQVVEAGASKSSEVLSAARSLVGKVDVIYVPTDNTIVSAFSAVVKVGQSAKLPVIAADTDSVRQGAIAALGFNYYDVGRQTGKIVVQILKGAKAGDIAVQGIDKLELFVNPASALKMGVTLDSSLIAEAKEVITE
ncbi:MAG: ABC transporter substrate-binding protein [Gammaproteobacteria bacterium]|nr:ABC transporter substrate-binding protein [Gammaproteobacteria bacterium]MBL6999001.1 ABC transporter substrate-binding protein [Gammaproteobacteria bacterium]